MSCINKLCCKVFLVPLTPEEHKSNMYLLDLEYLEINMIIVRKKINGECIYFENGCTIYVNRPEACREYNCQHDNRLTHITKRSTK